MDRRASPEDPPCTSLDQSACHHHSTRVINARRHPTRLCRSPASIQLALATDRSYSEVPARRGAERRST
eukprot:15472405-Alexandrium_andersonii.AAC.1